MLQEYEDGRTCPTHKEFVRFEWHAADEYWYAWCTAIDRETNSRCRFYHRKTDRNTDSATLTVPPPATSVPDTGGDKRKIPCTSWGCDNKRVAEDCPRLACAPHCRSLGGCRKHDVDGYVKLFVHPPSSTPPIPDPTLHATQFASTSLGLQLSNHMRDTFTHTQMAAARKLNEQITFVLYTQEDLEPTITVLQDQLVIAQEYLELTESLLEELDIFYCPMHLSLYFPSLGMWARVAVPGHVVRLSPQRVIFLKDCSVEHCQDFDELKTRLLDNPPTHFTNDLQLQQQEIKVEIKAPIIAGAHPSKSKRPMPSPEQTHTVKRSRQESPGPSGSPSPSLRNEEEPQPIASGGCIRRQRSRKQQKQG